MNATKHSWTHALRVGQFFTPRGFIVSACQISALFLVMHVAGLRACTTIFIGAAPAPGFGGRLAAGLGLAYIVFYLAVTVIAPVLLIAAGLWTLGSVLRRRLMGSDPR